MTLTVFIFSHDVVTGTFAPEITITLTTRIKQWFSKH